MTEPSQAWTLYWRNNTPQSCIASQNTSDAKAIEAIWCQFVTGLKHDARILDLATGNGAVPKAMLQDRQSYSITAVDRADIQPLKYLETPGHLQRVHFIGGVDAAKLPMADDTFDALSSQFGIEYGDLGAIAKEISRVLLSGGRCQFLMHHRDSAIVSPNALLIKELENCLGDGGLVEKVQAFLRGQCSAGELEREGQKYLQSEGRKTRQISGQLFEGIGIILKAADRNPDEASAIAADMITRLKAEHTRLKQMEDASLNADEIQQFTRQLTSGGLVMSEAEAMLVGTGEDKALVGWLLRGVKT